MRPKIMLLAAALALNLLLGGCFGYHEVDESAYILALGLDRGRENILSVSAQVAIPRNIAGGGGDGGGGGGGAESFFVVTMEAPTLLSALEMINAFVDRRADLSHTKAIIFSRDLAEEDITRYFAPLARFRQFRRHTYVMVSNDSPRKLLEKNDPLLENNPAKFFELMMGGNRYTEFIPFTQFHHFYLGASSPLESPFAALVGLQREEPGPIDRTYKTKGSYTPGRIPRQGGNEMEIMGAAVFRSGRMVGTINGDEIGLVRMLHNDFRHTIMSLKDPLHPDRFVVLEIIPQKPPDIRVDINGEQTAITAQVFLEADIISIQSGEDYEDPGRITMINEALERRLNGELMRIIQRCQREFRSDIFGFGNYARWRVYTWDELLALNWHERFPEARVDVAVEVEVRRVGLLRTTYWEQQAVSFLTSNKAGNLHKTFGVMDTSEITWAKNRSAGTNQILPGYCGK